MEKEKPKVLYVDLNHPKKAMSPVTFKEETEYKANTAPQADRVKYVLAEEKKED